MNLKDYEIICVDDDLGVLDITSSLVQELGYNTAEFSHVHEAVSYIKKHHSKIMLILSDLRMDDINGFGFKKELKSKFNDIPFVIITGYWTKEMASEAMELGVEAFLEKPVDTVILKDSIEKFAVPRAELLEDEKEMVLGFVEETTPMLDEIESLILELEENPSSDKTLSVYFRLLHTIKGTASCVGLTNLGHFTHSYEDFIGELRNKTIPVNTQSTNILLQGLDDLKEFFDCVNKYTNDYNIDYLSRVDKFKPENFDLSSGIDEKLEVEGSSEFLIKSSKQQVDEKKEDDKMTVSMGILNDFMEESGELTVIRNSILKTVRKIDNKFRGDPDIELLNELLEGMHSVTSNIQGKITEMRKVPLKNTFRPFKRLVRDLSKKLNKKVELDIIGDDVSVDNIIAKLYNNTLIHIVRNSLDHGLETPEQRVAAGKSPEGRVEFKVYEDGEDIVLEIHDDGKGINPDFIKNKALEKKLFSKEELDNMSDLEIINIIFASGFSTAEQVSDLSGRGVGMDMVRSSFAQMGGQIFVKSTPGEGSVFHLSVPIPKSILIINTLIVTASKKHFFFKMDEVSEVIRYEHDLAHSQMYSIDGKKIINHNNEMIQLYSLSEALGLPQCEESSEVDNIVVLRAGQSKYGVLVDEIHEFEEVVSRKISDNIDSSNLFAGASVLGSGEVAMIMCAQGMANHIGIELDLSAKKKSLTQVEEILDKNINEYMLFKYTDKEYLSVQLDKVDRLETMNIDSFESTGDNIIINYLNKPLQIIDPAFILGLTTVSLFESLKSQDDKEVFVIVVKDETKTFGLLVKSLDEIQQTQEDLNTDTIVNNGLLGSVYIKNKTICVIDLTYISSVLNSKKTLNDIKEVSASVLEFNNIKDLAA